MKLKLQMFLYNLLTILLLPLIFLRLFLKSLKSPNYRKRLLERLGIFKSPNLKDSIWIHSVSLGEAIASIPVINAIKQNFPNVPLVITTTTPTGSNKITQTFKDSIFHVYLPYDFCFAINAFLRKTKPKALILMETELWLNILSTCKKKNIKTFLVNARLSNKSRKNYERFPTITKNIMECLNFVFAQYKHDADNFLKLGLKKDKLQITGNIKFDVKIPEDKINAGLTIKKNINDKIVLCVASTHNLEEKIILEIFTKLLKNNPKIFLILVPRHPERFREVENLINDFKLSYVTRTSKKEISDDTKILLGDTIGEMMSFYAASDIAFVAGSLVPIGGHNVLEPASLEKPIITGPYLHNFKAITNLMNEENALIITKDQEDLYEKLLELISNENLRKQLATNSKNFFNKNKGALLKTISKISSSITIT